MKIRVINVDIDRVRALLKRVRVYQGGSEIHGVSNF
jgi:hypothetical protein